MTQHTLGVLGTGHFASYTIKALRNGGYSGRILLSPRNAAYAAALSADQGCEIANDNAAVVAASDTVLLSVRPHQLTDVLDGLTFGPEQTVVSSIAGVTVAALQAQGLPENTVRIMPSSFIEAGDAVFPLYPANAFVQSLLGDAGRVVVFDDEAAFEQSVLVACAYSWNYDLLASLVNWFVENGWPEDVARDMVVRSLRGTTTYALANPDTSLDDISAGIATDGTFTKSGLDHLNQRGAFTPWTEALNKLDEALKQS